MGKTKRVLIRAGEDDDLLRADVFLTGRLPEYSRSFIQSLIRGGAFRRADDAELPEGETLLEEELSPDDDADEAPAGEIIKKPGAPVKGGAVYELTVTEREQLNASPQDIPLDIVYEDESILIVNKPKGMVVHPARGHADGTLVNAVMFHCGSALAAGDDPLRPGIVHRIDQDTTGLLVVCKTDRAQRSLAQQLQEHSITRQYRAIVHGNIKQDEGTVDAPIGRHPTDRLKMAVAKGGRRAVTHYRVLERFGSYTYIACELETGRTHQIRVHMSSIGHPVLGDAVYGPAKCPVKGLQGQTLHAMTLGFVHPATGETVSFEAPLPEYFEKLLEKLRAGRSGGPS